MGCCWFLHILRSLIHLCLHEWYSLYLEHHSHLPLLLYVLFETFFSDAPPPVCCAQSCVTLRPHGLPGSSVHGISQARILECHFFLQGIFPTQGSSLGLLCCKQILYHLNHQGNPWWCWAELNTISASISLCIWGCKLWALWETISYLSVYSCFLEPYLANSRFTQVFIALKYLLDINTAKGETQSVKHIAISWMQYYLSREDW